MDRRSSHVTLVAMEAESEWPYWLESEPAHEVIVVAQARDASPGDLAERVLHRLSTLEGSGQQATLAVIAVTERKSDEGTESARSLIGRALCDHLRRADAGRLLLACSDRASTHKRASLLELAGALVREGGEHRATTGLRFHATSQGLAKSDALAPATRAA